MLTKKIQRLLEVYSLDEMENWEEMARKLIVELELIDHAVSESAEHQQIMKNFISCITKYLRDWVGLPHKHVEICALYARSIYEVSLLVDYLLANSNKMITWAKEAQRDQDALLSGLIRYTELCGAPVPEKAISARARLKQLTGVEDLEKMKSLSKDISDVAKKLGRGEEYKDLNRTFSKFVHPTSFAINSGDEVMLSEGIRRILVFHIFLFSYSIIDSVRHST